MSAKFLLGAVLKVRKLREDIAKAEAASAQAASYRAATDYARRQAALAGRPTPGTAEASQWLAVRAGSMALASDAALAREVAAARQADAAAAMGQFASARREREGVEDLAERHFQQQQRELDAAEQRESDDRAAARRFAAAPQEEH